VTNLFKNIVLAIVQQVSTTTRAVRTPPLLSFIRIGPIIIVVLVAVIVYLIWRLEKYKKGSSKAKP
jgi:hypothetical protein